MLLDVGTTLFVGAPEPTFVTGEEPTVEPTDVVDVVELLVVAAAFFQLR